MPNDALAQNARDMQMWRADDLTRQGKWLHAVQCLLRVVDDNPTHVAAYLELAHIYMDHRQWRPARDLLLRGLVHLPGDPLLNLHLGNTYLGDGDLDRAVAAYRATLSAERDNAAALYNLGLALVRKGRNAEAITHLKDLASQRPDYPGLADLLGNTYLNIGRSDRALEVLLPAETRTPDSHRLLYLLALALCGEGLWDEALPRLRKAHAQNPDDAEIMRCLGWVLLRLDRTQEGEHWLRRAVETDPGLVYAHVNLAIVYHDQERYEEGRAALETARRLDPGNPIVASLLRQWETGDAPVVFRAIEELHGTRGEDRDYAQR